MVLLPGSKCGVLIGYLFGNNNVPSFLPGNVAVAVKRGNGSNKLFYLKFSLCMPSACLFYKVVSSLGNSHKKIRTKQFYKTSQK